MVVKTFPKSELKEICTAPLLKSLILRSILTSCTYSPDLGPESRPELRPESRPELNLEGYLEAKLYSKIAAKILLALKIHELSTSQLANTLGHKTVSGELKKQISRLLLQNLIEKTLPDNPQSRLQKYRLTLKGVKILQNFEVKE